MGGQDQWGNIVAGIDLTRRLLNKQVYGITFPLITTSSGEKFGKSAGNAIWLDRRKTSSFEFYQYWRNVDDRDVERYLALFTLLPMDEVRRLPKENINRAKEILAYEVTKMAHGREEAVGVYSAAVGQYGASDPEGRVNTSSDITKISPKIGGKIPEVKMSRKMIKSGMWIVRLLVEAGLCSSNGDARRLIRQRGAYLNDDVILDENFTVKEKDLEDDHIIVRAGKKRVRKIVFI